MAATVYDDIVVGSGLTALATVMGLSGRGRRVLVCGGPKVGVNRYYPVGVKTPCARLGRGGLGEHWHGVIPLSLRKGRNEDASRFASFLALFYPRRSVEKYLGRDMLFVPWRAIRPTTAFEHLVRKDPDLEVCSESVVALDAQADGRATIWTSSVQLVAKRIWIAAGALFSPSLLGQVLGGMSKERPVSDHVIGYLGQLSADDPKIKFLNSVAHTRDGVLFPCFYSADGATLYTLRPARFDFASLDSGIEKRALFGLPTSRVAVGIAGNLSPGLLAEAIFNKTGLGTRAHRYSVYFQTVVRNAYSFDVDGYLRSVDLNILRASCELARETHPFEKLTLSRRPDIFIPGVHLHGSLTTEECDFLASIPSLHVVDPGAWHDIGPEHHSFKIMASAYLRSSCSQ